MSDTAAVRRCACSLERPCAWQGRLSRLATETLRQNGSGRHAWVDACRPLPTPALPPRGERLLTLYLHSAGLGRTRAPDSERLCGAPLGRDGAVCMVAYGSRARCVGVVFAWRVSPTPLAIPFRASAR